MKLLALITIFFMGVSAQAGLMIEPYVGYQMGSYNLKFKDLDLKEEGAQTGAGYGLRLGYSLPVLAWIALDGQYGSGKQKPKDTTVFNEAKYKSSALFLDVGIDLPILLRAWVGYGFSNQLDLDYDTGTDYTLKGTATKFGLGFTPLPLFSVNVEAITNSYTTVSPNLNNSDKLSDTYSETKNTAIFVSISLPLDL